MPHTDYCPINYLIQQIAVDYPLRIAWQIINCFRSICKIKNETPKTIYGIIMKTNYVFIRAILEGTSDGAT